jgi:hypothetical protein
MSPVPLSSQRIDGLKLPRSSPSTRALQPPLRLTTGRKRRRRPRPRLPRIALIAVQLSICTGGHRSIAGVTYLAASPANLAGNLGELSSDSFRPSDLHHTPQIKSLIESVRDNLVRPDLIRSNAPRCVSDRTGMPQPEHATCRIQT